MPGRVPTAGPARPPWKIGVKDPLRDERRLGQVELHDRALGTSGAQFQSFRHRGRRYGHILDPRTGWPAEGVLSVTVLAPTAAEADALSTAFYVMGPEAAMSYCRQHPSIAAMVFARRGGQPLGTASPRSGRGIGRSAGRFDKTVSGLLAAVPQVEWVLWSAATCRRFLTAAVRGDARNDIPHF